MSADPWFYISFADDDGFLGGVYVEGRNEAEALLRSHALGINPGGEAMLVGPIPPERLREHVRGEDRDRLLTAAEVKGSVHDRPPP